MDDEHVPPLLSPLSEVAGLSLVLFAIYYPYPTYLPDDADITDRCACDSLAEVFQES